MAFTLSGCAFMNPKKRPFLDLMDRRLQPEDPWTKLGLLPIMMPLGITALTSDIIFFYPVGQIGPSKYAVKRAYWGNPDTSPAAEAALFVPKLLIAVPDFLLIWGVHSFFDVADLPEPEKPALPDWQLPEDSEPGSVH